MPIMGEPSVSGDTNQSMFGRISNSFQILSTKMKHTLKDAFDFYGRPVAEYAQAIREMFHESYFLEQWIKELLMVPEMQRTEEEKILLNKLSRISKFFQEEVLSLVLGDLMLLLNHYYID